MHQNHRTTLLFLPDHLEPPLPSQSLELWKLSFTSTLRPSPATTGAPLIISSKPPKAAADVNALGMNSSTFLELIKFGFLLPMPNWGSSKDPLGVVITHGNLIAAVELFVRFEASQYEAESWENVYLDVLPMFRVYGLALCAVGLLSLGSKVVVMRRFSAEEAVRVIDRYGVTHFPIVPPIMGALVRAKEATGLGLRSLRQVSCGAAPLSRKVIQDFVMAFPHVDFIQGYGMTESTAVGTRGFNTVKSKKYGSVGLLAPNMQAKVVDWQNGSFLPPGGIGELWLRGPAIMKGYLNDENETSSTMDKDGWLRTGDITYFDQDGYLYVLDRLKDTIKYKGFQIAPADLEGLLICHPEILDVAVTFAEDEEAGEIPMAFVVRVPGS